MSFIQLSTTKVCVSNKEYNKTISLQEYNKMLVKNNWHWT